MAKAKALDPDNWSTLSMVACALPLGLMVVGGIIGARFGPPDDFGNDGTGGTLAVWGLGIGCALWLVLTLRPLFQRRDKPKRDPLVDPREGDILKGYVYVGDETWEALIRMPSVWWQFRASPTEYNAALASVKAHADN